MVPIENVGTASSGDHNPTIKLTISDGNNNVAPTAPKLNRRDRRRTTSKKYARKLQRKYGLGAYSADAGQS